jgi:hypothetical protein
MINEWFEGARAYKKEDTGWKLVMYHKDLQPFNKDGTYPKHLTEIK